MTIRIVGLGGTYRPASATEQALRIALDCCAELGAETTLLGADALDLPMYRPGAGAAADPKIAHLVDALRRADGIIVASPGYHGGISGLVKNGLDYAEELRPEARPYFDGRAVGCIVTAAGWQATASTLMALRSVVHALRGWPTPLGATINTSETSFTVGGLSSTPAVNEQLRVVAGQVMEFSTWRAGRSK